MTQDTRNVYYGRCDTCAEPLEERGKPAVRWVGNVEVTFRFCSDACRERFKDRDSIREVPGVAE